MVRVGWIALAVGGSLLAGSLARLASRAEEPRPIGDPAAWGSDHVGRPFPDFVSGDECLFCHRKIGPTWPQNPHQLTVRPATPDDPAVQALRRFALAQEERGGGSQEDVTPHFLLGSRRRMRFLRRTKRYGILEMLTAGHTPPKDVPQPQAGGKKTPPAPLSARRSKHPHGFSPTARLMWEADVFAARCAGCHATAADAKTGAFAAVSHDCFVCHGNAELAHSRDKRRVFLSTTNRPPRVVGSICGQCHLRGGKSRSTGKPYANTFVAGDNLFRDYRVDWSDRAIAKLPTREQHIYLNAREVATSKTVGSKAARVDCLSCHRVHARSTRPHKRLPQTRLCLTCHRAGADGKLQSGLRKSSAPRGNRTCRYPGR